MSLITTHPAPIIVSATIFRSLLIIEPEQSQLPRPTETLPESVTPGERCT